MTERSEIFSHLSIKGFTLNPLKDPRHIRNLLYGLGTTYNKKHPCDWDDSLIHTYYFEKIIEESISCNYVEDEGFRGIVAFAALLNGYYVLRIWDEYEPAQIEFNVYVKGDLDPDVCLDHLKAPVSKTQDITDGLGMFDFTYSLTKQPVLFNSIMKNNKKIKAYETDLNGYNTLNIIGCHFCKMQAKYWGILPPEPNKFYMESKENEWIKENYKNGYYKNTFMSVPVCENHTGNIAKE
jgi:hypothetical protein